MPFTAKPILSMLAGLSARTSFRIDTITSITSRFHKPALDVDAMMTTRAPDKSAG